MTGDIDIYIERDFQTGYFADFEQFKIDSHFDDFGQVKIDLELYLSLGKTLGCKK